MRKRKVRRDWVFGLGAAAGALILATAASADDLAPRPTRPAPSLIDAVNAGKPIFEDRSRWEHVDQPSFANAADAYTTRLLIGWETAPWFGMKGLVEYKIVQHIGAADFNSTTNGKIAYPTVPDPDTQELNRAQLAWKPNDVISAVVGRQRIMLDDQRFVGNAGWRQDEQTFDAARVDVAYRRLKATYVYVEKVNRVFAQTQDWKADAHLFTATYSFAGALKAEGFLYALDFKPSPVNSTLTYGGKLSGSSRLSRVKLTYDGTFAHQTNYRNNPGVFGLDFWEGDLAAAFDIYTAKLVYESLQGDGVRGFGTPLATLHAFGGWDDVFLTTPKAGLRNLNASLGVKPRIKFKHLSNIDLTVRYHDFRAEQTGASLGHEWDLQAAASLTPKLTGLIKFADYAGPTPTVPPYLSRRKVWVGFEFKL